MGEFPDSSLWHFSDFERQHSAGSAHAPLAGNSSMLPSSMLGELGRIDRSPWRGDALEVLAACLRQREAALFYLGLAARVWPLTVFPREGLYHCPRDILGALGAGVRELRLLSLDPPLVRPPGHWQSDRVADAARYHALNDLTWALALHGPRHTLLGDLQGAAAFRITAEFQLGHLPAQGALAPALQRLRTEMVSLPVLARWPGMTPDRAARLLNALYLQSGLMVLRSPSAAGAGGGWFSRWRERSAKRGTPPRRQ